MSRDEGTHDGHRNDKRRLRVRGFILAEELKTFLHERGNETPRFNMLWTTAIA